MNSGVSSGVVPQQPVGPPAPVTSRQVPIVLWSTPANVDALVTGRLRVWSRRPVRSDRQPLRVGSAPREFPSGSPTVLIQDTVGL
jgi:hypothetical protein